MHFLSPPPTPKIKKRSLKCIGPWAYFRGFTVFSFDTEACSVPYVQQFSEPISVTINKAATTKTL